MTRLSCFARAITLSLCIAGFLGFSSSLSAAPAPPLQMNGGQASGFLGAWCAQGDPTKHASISGNGVFLTLTNENGDTSPGNLQGSNGIQAPGWQFVSGTLSPDGSQINWSNGTYWARCDNGSGRHRPNLTGTWFANGDRSRSCSISQRRGNLTLQNELGQDRKSTRLNSSHGIGSRMPSSA